MSGDSLIMQKEDFRNLMGMMQTLGIRLENIMEQLTRQNELDVHKTLLTTEEAAYALGFRTAEAFRKQRRENPGKLPDPIRVGGTVRYRAIDLEKWVMAQVPVQATE